MANAHEKHMARALELAEKGRGFTSPNPMVGAVIVKDGRVIAEGYHQRFGEAHAEVNALRQAGEAARGATLYVTLEPCCHFGKTPPCTRAVIEAGVTRVVMAMEDPHPRVAGKGRAELERAGIAVETGVLEDRARRLNEWFSKYVTTGMPFFTAKAAMTLDGKIATRTGHSRWITGEAAREYVHWLRAGVDAVMVGSRTVEADDPLLTTRMGAVENGRDAVRVIVDGDARCSPARRVFGLKSAGATVVAVKTTANEERKRALRNAGADVVEIEPRGDKVDLVELARLLGARSIASVLVEGGGGLLAAALEAGIIDKVLFFVAPKIIGGKDAPTPVEGVGVERMDDAIRVGNVSVRRFGDDVLIEAYVER
ncbi:MAG: bifunctional diaminohydroxyphosphoribosylaminopyrimidine deaminase/5-amino-6-(5-phosphoribosylamino)uracil reductase RibD [Candidatus Abyssubacteria bacterium]